MLAVLVTRLAGLIPPVAYAALVVILMLGLGVQTKRLSGAHTEAATLRANYDQCEAANQTNAASLTQLSEVNRACLDGRRVDATRYAVAVAGWAEIEARLNAESELLNAQRIEIYNDADCKLLGEISISNLCPGLADSLRGDAASYYED